MSAPRDPTRIPQLGESPELARLLTSLTLDDPVAPDVYEVDGSFVVARLADIRAASEEIDDELYREIESAIWQDKVRALFGNWAQRLLFHQPVALGSIFRERLNAAMADGSVSFDEGYFLEPEPEPTEEAN
jgi:prepilin-type processing-associated H-X9-DG protein